MNTYHFCIKEDCRLACKSESEQLAWEWLSATKHLSISALKKLYKIKKV
jgi:hypothetical protein